LSRAQEYDAVDDGALVARARQGDVRALETLLDRHQAPVLRVLRLLGVPVQDREDVAQEVLVRIFRHLGSFKTGKSFSGWVYRITVNAAHDHRHRLRRQSRGETPWTGEIGDDEGPGPERGLELRQALETALGILSERERAVFVLREMEGLETRDVAKALGITSITVRRHLGRARSRLQDALSDYRKKDRAALNDRRATTVNTGEGKE
jgi:RNA polymerase sigma-70 factor (ECF subfamily)